MSNTLALPRRDFLRAAALGAAGLGLSSLFPAWAQTGSPGLLSTLPTLAGQDIRLRVGAQSVHGRRPHRPCHHPQRRAACAAHSTERGPECPAARRERAGRGHLDPLARADPSVPDGRRAGHQLSRHQAAQHLHLRIPDQAERHLLVSQPFRASGAAGPLRPDRDRSGRRRSGRLRPRACDRAQRLELPPPAPDHLEAQAGGRLFQPPEADARRAC